MGGAVIFVIAIASLVTNLIQQFILVPTGMEYLQTIVFILVIAALVQFVEMFLKKAVPSLYQALGVFLPLITTNCAVLGAAITITQKGYGIFTGLVYGLGTAIGFTIAIILLAGVRERLEEAKIPSFMQGLPIVMISAALISIAFLGFQGLSF